jgi:hypothetical protein
MADRHDIDNKCFSIRISDMLQPDSWVKSTQKLELINSINNNSCGTFE